MPQRKPWVKWYWTDWRGDPRLRMCCLAARALWAEMLALMQEADPYGHLLVNGLAPTDAQLASLAGAPSEQIPDLIRELESAGVFSRSRNRVIYSRRMTRDEKRRKDGETAEKTSGNVPGSRRHQVIERTQKLLPPPVMVDGVADPPPLTQSPESRVQKESKNLRSRQTPDGEFEEWYAAYPLHKARGAAVKAFGAARKKAPLEVLVAGAHRYAAECRAKGTEAKWIAHPSTWLNEERWSDEPDLLRPVPVASSAPGHDLTWSPRLQDFDRGTWHEEIWGPPPNHPEFRGPTHLRRKAREVA